MTSLGKEGCKIISCFGFTIIYISQRLLGFQVQSDKAEEKSPNISFILQHITKRVPVRAGKRKATVI